MVDWRHQLRLVWEQYLSDGEVTPLLAFLEAHPESMLPCSHDYPELHRICDIVLGERPFRVIRCFTCGERLTFQPIPPNMADSRLGVAYWLSGAKLARWIEDDRGADPGEPVDWEKYR